MENKPVFILLEALIETRSRQKIPLHIGDWQLREEAVKGMLKYKNNSLIVILANNTYNSNKLFTIQLHKICNVLEEVIKYKGTIHFEFESNPDSYRYLPKDGMICELCVEHEINYTDVIIVTDF